MSKGRDLDGSLILEWNESAEQDREPKTMWVRDWHDASTYGTNLIEKIIPKRNFPFPKSLYAVQDTLRFFVANKKNALVVDFFSGSGTTLHAVNLLNAEDQGRRRCIMVTNNEVSEDESKVLKKEGFHPGAVSYTHLGKYMLELVNQDQHLDVVFVDPPRKGCSTEFLDNLIQAEPKKIIYISCDVATQARDIKYLQEFGYHADVCQPVDMFPHTTHIETVVLLSKLKTKKHIDIELHTDELDLTSSESKATYQEIKEYVKDKFDLKVSTLNIAQTKTKCGIIERECYRKPKNENAKQPKCTLEKENAIKDAFKHFQMI